MESTGSPAERPKLNLARRTIPTGASSGRSDTNSIFGGARPREEILSGKGIDVAKVEAKLDKKIQRLPRMTKEQREQFESLEELTRAAQANVDQATDEEKGAKQAEYDKLKKEMTDLVEGIRNASLAEEGTKRPTFMRPSERRRLREERESGGEGGNYQGGGNYGGNNYGDHGGSYGGSYGGQGNRQSGGYNQGGGYGGQERTPNLCKIYIGNLNFNTDDARIYETFKYYGNIKDLHMPKERDTGRLRGFAFVTYDNPESAQRAVAEANGRPLDGRGLKVNLEGQSSGRGGYGGGGDRGGYGGGGGGYGGGGGGYGGGDRGGYGGGDRGGYGGGGYGGGGYGGGDRGGYGGGSYGSGGY